VVDHADAARLRQRVGRVDRAPDELGDRDARAIRFVVEERVLVVRQRDLDAMAHEVEVIGGNAVVTLSIEAKV
jgi:hypothetical protein